MAYGKSNGHLLDDVTCPESGLLIRNWLHIVAPFSESIKLLEIYT